MQLHLKFMRGSHALHFSETAAQRVPKVVTAFLIGLVTVSAGGLIFSNFLQSREPVQPVNFVAATRPVISSTDKVPAVQNSTRTDESSKNVSQASDAAAQAEMNAGLTAETPARSDQMSSPGTTATQPAPFRSPASFGSEQQQANGTSAAAPTPIAVPRHDYTPARDQQPPAIADAHEAAAEQVQHSPAAAVINSPVVASEPPRPITVLPGTAVSIRLGETLSSDHSRTGDTFRATLASALVTNGIVVAPAGAIVLGRVVNARKAPLVRGRSELSFRLDSITGTDGRPIKVVTNVYEQEGSHINVVNSAKMATGAAVGAVVGAVTGAAEGAGLTSGLRNRDRTDGFMATKRTIVLPAGSEVALSLATPVTVFGSPDRR